MSIQDENKVKYVHSLAGVPKVAIKSIQVKPVKGFGLYGNAISLTKVDIEIDTSLVSKYASVEELETFTLKIEFNDIKSFDADLIDGLLVLSFEKKSDGYFFKTFK